jgi:hypothetical protein
MASMAWPFSDRSTTFQQRMHHPRLIHVHDKFFVAHRQSTLEPAGDMQHEFTPARHVGSSVCADSNAA